MSNQELYHIGLVTDRNFIIFSGKLSKFLYNSVYFEREIFRKMVLHIKDNSNLNTDDKTIIDVFCNNIMYTDKLLSDDDMTNILKLRIKQIISKLYVIKTQSLFSDILYCIGETL